MNIDEKNHKCNDAINVIINDCGKVKQKGINVIKSDVGNI